MVRLPTRRALLPVRWQSAARIQGAALGGTGALLGVGGLVGLLALAGCHWVLPYRGDSTGEQDAARDALVGDGPRVDDGDAALASGDGRPELPGRGDQRAADGPVGGDQRPPDGSTQDWSPASMACAGGAALSYEYQGNMVICTGTTGITQCQASGLCLAAWHLCTSTEFQARGGRTTPAKNLAAWIAGCSYRSGSSYGALQPEVCNNNCPSTVVSTDLQVGWPCPSPPGYGTSSIFTHVGVQTFSYCSRIGQNTLEAEGYWFPTMAGASNSKSAVCCF